MVVYTVLEIWICNNVSNIETLLLSADYYRCQWLHLAPISCLLSLLHICIKSNISQLLDALTASSDVLSIPQSPVRVCLLAPIDIINWKDLLISSHSASVDTYGDGLNVSCLWWIFLPQSSKSHIAETSKRVACWLITSSFIVRVMQMYLCVCEWLAWMPPGVHLFVNRLWDEACVRFV